MLIADIPRRNARRYPNKTAVVFETTRYTFREVNDRINSLANALADMGLRKGDKIVILSDNCHQYIEIFFAAAKAGLVVALVNPMLSQRELSYLINNAEAKVVIFSQDNKHMVDSLRSELKETKIYIVIGAAQGEIRAYEELISFYPSTEPKARIDKDDLLLLPCTGGTTGLPKQVMYSHGSLAAMVLDCLWIYNTSHEDIYLFFVPPFWSVVFPAHIIPQLYVGSTVVVAKGITPKSFLEIVEKEGVTASFFASSFLPQFLDYSDLDKYNYRSLQRVLVAGAPLPAQVWQRAIKTFGSIFGQLYGLCEMSPVSFLPPEDFVVEGPPESLRRLRSCGRETLITEVRAVDEEGNDVLPGQIGEIIARGKCMMKGYWKAPEATEQTIRGGYLYTGDLATLDEDGYIYLAGRKKDAIVSGGNIISSSEVEDIIYRHPSVLEVAVIGTPDESLGEAVKAIVVLKQVEKASQEELISLCQQNLPIYAVPKSVDFVNGLPKSSVGKVLKHVLRGKYAEPKA